MKKTVKFDTLALGARYHHLSDPKKIFVKLGAWDETPWDEKNALSGPRHDDVRTIDHPSCEVVIEVEDAKEFSQGELAKKERVDSLLVPRAIWREVEDDVLEIFGLGYFTYNSFHSRLGETLIHYLFDEDEWGGDHVGFHSKTFADLYGYDESLVEAVTYMLAGLRNDKDEYFEYGSSPRGMWPTEEGRKMYEIFLEKIAEAVATHPETFTQEDESK